VVVVAEAQAVIAEDSGDGGQLGREPPDVGDRAPVLLRHGRHEHTRAAEGAESRSDSSRIAAETFDPLVGGNRAQAGLLEQSRELRGREVGQSRELHRVVARVPDSPQGPREVGRQFAADAEQLDGDLVDAHDVTVRYRGQAEPSYARRIASTSSLVIWSSASIARRAPSGSGPPR
jgi:hypothetical protein